MDRLMMINYFEEPKKRTPPHPQNDERHALCPMNGMINDHE
jgi:hypothetical protein